MQTKQLLAVTLAAAMSLGLMATIQMQTQTAEASNVKCGDLKTLILKFSKPVHDFNVNVCPSGGGSPGPAGPAGPAGAAGANGINGVNGLNGTTLPADVIDKVNALSAKEAVLTQIIAAFENGTLGNGGGVEIGCIAFPNGTSVGDCPVDNGTGTGPVDNGTVITPPVDNGTGGTGPVDNGTVITPPVDNTTTTTNTTTTENTTSTETNSTGGFVPQALSYLANQLGL